MRVGHFFNLKVEAHLGKHVCDLCVFCQFRLGFNTGLDLRLLGGRLFNILLKVLVGVTCLLFIVILVVFFLNDPVLLFGSLRRLDVLNGAIILNLDTPRRRYFHEFHSDRTFNTGLLQFQCGFDSFTSFAALLQVDLNTFVYVELPLQELF